MSMRTIPLGLCQCGCGETTTIAKRSRASRGDVAGQPRLWRSGHAARVFFGTVEQRFYAKVNKTDSCWLWTGARNPSGYGMFRYEGRQQAAHRAAFQMLRGPIPEGLQLDHLCRNRRCVNPDHLEPVTRLENVRRGLSGVLTTHCPEGHEYTTDNTYLIPRTGAKQCRECKRAADRRYRLRRAGHAVPHLPAGPGWNRRS